MKYLFLVLMLFTQVLHAQEMQYPELNVTPRAKERLRLEVRNEAGSAWSSHLAVQLPALSLLVSGAMGSSKLKTEKDGNGKDVEVEGAEYAPMLAMATGAFWLGVTSWAAMNYRPYKRSYLSLKKMPYKTKRQKLTAERLAEEEINSLRTIGKRIRYFSVASNFIASVYLAGSTEEETSANIMASTSALLSLAPLFFKYHWETVADEQEKYKKRIFSPVAMMPILRDPITNSQASGISLLYRF